LILSSLSEEDKSNCHINFIDVFGKFAKLPLEEKMIKKISRFALKYLCSAISCLYLFTIGFFFTKGRLIINEFCILFGYDFAEGTKLFEGLKAAFVGPNMKELYNDYLRTLKKMGEHGDTTTYKFTYFLQERSKKTKDKYKIPKTDFPQGQKIHSIKLFEPIYKSGNVELSEIVAINTFIQIHNPTLIFEIGTFDGRTTLNMAANSSLESKIYTLDLPKDQVNSTILPLCGADFRYIKKDISGHRYLNMDYENKIFQLYGDSADFDFSPFFNKIDFVFVDGSHSYEYVLNDTKTALKLLKNGNAIILWHDYGVCNGVTKALNELYSENKDLRGIRHIEGTSLVYLNLKQNC
jgi:hypothetical protein